MKKIAYILSVILAAVACSKTERELPENSSDFQETVDNTIKFSAVFEDAPVAKSEISGTSVLWEAGDEISILWDGGSTTAHADSAGAKANFIATVGQAAEYFAVYPSTAKVSLSEGSLTVGIPAEQNGKFEDANIAIAKTSARNLVFKNLCALGKITLERDDIAEIVFKGNGEDLAGEVSISLDAQGVPTVSSVASPAAEIVLRPDSGDAFAVGTYYFATIPGTLEKIQFTLTTTSGNTIFVRGFDNSVNLVRSASLNFSIIDNIKDADYLQLHFKFGPEKGAKATFDPDNNWPDTGETVDYTNGQTYSYTIDGTEYNLYIQNTDGYANGPWRTNNENGYPDCIGFTSTNAYFGLPVIDGFRITKAIVGQCRRGSTDKTASVIHKVGITDCIPTSKEVEKTYVSGGGLQEWPGWDNTDNGKMKVKDHEFNLTGTAANTMYYINGNNDKVGLYFAHLTLTYENPNLPEDGSQEGGQETTQNIAITENGQSTWAIAYDKLKGNAAEFIEAFTSYTKCSPQTYTETSQQSAQEILIGQTTRQETKDALKGIKNGFKIAFQWEKLVIAGTDDTWTAVALYEFEKKVLKSSQYVKNGNLTIPSNFTLSENYDDPQTIARLLKRGYTEFTLSHEKVMNCPGEGAIKVAQGAASDGNYVYFVLRNSGDSQAMVFKYDMTGNQVAKSDVFNGGHCNDMTLNTNTSTLYVAHGSTAPNSLRPLAAGNLSYGANVDISVGTGAITYNESRDNYATSQGGKNLVIYDATLNKLQSYSRTDKTGYTPQGMGSDDHYIYFPMSPKTTSDDTNINILVVYDWNGNYITTLKVNLDLESESMFYAGENYYVNFHVSGSGANLYKIVPALNYSFNK